MEQRGRLLRDRVLPRSSLKSNRGSILIKALFGLGTVALLGVVGVWYAFFQGQELTGTEDAILKKVMLKPFSHVVFEKGELESANNTEIRCSVKGRNSNGIEIHWVIPAGTIVEKNQKVLEFDSSQLKLEEVQQQINCNTSHAIKVTAENNYLAAVISKTEYLEGTFKQEENKILSEIFVSQENLSRTQRSIQSSQRLAAKGLVTPLQLLAEQFAIDKAELELEAAQTKLDVLRKYTKEKKLKELESDIASAKAKWDSEEASYRLELEKLAEIREQIDNCTVLSPSNGQIVHANKFSSRGNSEFIVEEGAKVREGQVILRIPDSSDMMVEAKITEAHITLVQPGMPVEIYIGAISDQPQKGVVQKVNEYPEPTSFFSSNIKKYKTHIKLLEPPEGVKPGLTAEARIFVQQLPEALQIPVQAIYEHGGEFFVLVNRKNDFQQQQVSIGASNNKTVVITEGLQVNDEVVMNIRQFSHLLDLPKLELEKSSAPEPPADIAAGIEPEAQDRAEEQQPDSGRAKGAESRKQKSGRRPKGASGL